MIVLIGIRNDLILEPKVKSFVEDTAEKLGVSTRTIERRLWLAEHLAPGAAKILKEMGKQQPSQGELMTASEQTA